MGLFSGMAGALMGGMIGAAIWAAIAHFFNLEVGYIAWGVGLLVGLGFRFLGGDAKGPVAGIATAAIAVVSILAGKYCAVALALGAFGSESVEFFPEDGIAHEARQLAEARELKGEKINWPEVADDAPARETFPAEIWHEAEKTWHALTPAEQEQRLAQRRKEFQAIAGQLDDHLQWIVFRNSFNIIDLIFGFLAISTAYKLAAAGATTASSEADTSSTPAGT
jgi:hypothetical protein